MDLLLLRTEYVMNAFSCDAQCCGAGIVLQDPVQQKLYINRNVEELLPYLRLFVSTFAVIARRVVANNFVSELWSNHIRSIWDTEKCFQNILLLVLDKLFVLTDKLTHI